MAGMGVALFAGFVALTKWTGDDPGLVSSLDDQERGDLAQFCAVFSSGFAPYELVLRAGSGQGVAPEESVDIGILDSPVAQNLAQSQIDLLADRVPEEYGADARHAAEGLERALEGNLDADDVDEYVASFERLESEASEDCDVVGGIQFEPGGEGDDGFGEEDDGGRFGEDDPFGDGGPEVTIEGPGPPPTAIPSP